MGCQDAWDDAAYAKRCDGVEDPFVDAASDPQRVNRGGSWGSARGCRSASRSGRTPGYRCRFLGFRLCVSPGPAAEPEIRNKDKRSRNLESQARDEPKTEGGGGAGWSAGSALPAAPKKPSA